MLVPLRRIELPQGDVLHALKASEQAFHGFGEAYFSAVNAGQIKAWKRHRKMVSNLIVPVGSIRLKLRDVRVESSTFGHGFEVILGPKNYQRLTVPPGIWFGFEGLADNLNLMLNLASIEHDPAESEIGALDDPGISAHGW